MPKDYLSSAKAPSFCEVVEDKAINQYLDSLNVPQSSRLSPYLDSIPNRTRFFPTGLLFKRKELFVNFRLCNAHYKNIKKTISYYNMPRFLVKDYPLVEELKGIQNIDINELPYTEYYLVYYWSLSGDNINARHITNLQKSLQEEELSLTILYVNVDNRKEYNLTPEEYRAFLIKNRRKYNPKDSRWLQR